jgi:hypothetical protein
MLRRATVTVFHHIVLTRFNVRISDQTENPKGLQPEWLNRRLELFDLYCYPSLKQQTVQDFSWLVLFDSRTPDWFREKLNKYSSWKAFIPVYLDCPLPEEAGCPPSLKAAIAEQVPAGSTHLITTRIDNDDAIARNFLDSVRECYRGQDSQGIVFPIGYQLYGGKLYLEYSRGNHFVSLVEKLAGGSFSTVFVQPHNQLYLAAPILQVWRKPMWLEVLHGGNLANRYTHGLTVSPEHFRRNFALDGVELQETSPLSLRMDQLKFLSLGAPRYLATKAYNRLKFHGPFRWG